VSPPPGGTGGSAGTGGPSAEDLAGFRRGAEWAVVAGTALELGIVDALASGPAAPADLAARLELSGRGTGILLGALETLGLVREEDGAVRLTGVGRARLVARDTPDFEGDALRFWLANLRRWTGGLADAVRTGEPAVGEEDRLPEGIPAFMAAMANKRPALIDAVVRACLDRVPDAASVLDLGGGPGTFSRGFAKRGLRATLFDRPEVVEHVREAYGLAEDPAVELRAGDFGEALPEGTFDIVLLANITHIYGPEANARLLERAAGSVAPGGLLAILDFVRGEAPFASLFAVTMLLNSRHGGRTYDRAAYERWLAAAGLADVRLRAVDGERHLIGAVRRAAERGERAG